MSVYRQQAFVSPSDNVTDNEKMKVTEVFHQRSKSVAAYPSQVTTFGQRLPPQINNTANSLEVTAKQSKFISDTMRDLRKKELDDRLTKKLKADHVFSVDNFAVSNEFGIEEEDSHTSEGIDIVDEMELHPNICQIVATAGGLITVWNETFIDVVKPTSPMSQIPLTIFDLVEPKSLHKLYGMLALALDEEVIVKQEKASSKSEEDPTKASSHLSIILPAKKFRHSSSSYEMTIVFMEHIIPRERSFLGWIRPVPGSASISGFVSVSSDDELLPECKPDRRNILPRGTILRLENSVLCQLLRGKEHAKIN